MAPSRPAWSRPLSTLSGRSRLPVDARPGDLADVVKRAQSDPDKSPSPLARNRTKLKDLATSAAGSPTPAAGVRQSADQTAVQQTAPKTGTGVPTVRPTTLTVKVADATAAAAKVSADVVALAGDALPKPSALTLDATPVSALAVPVVPAVSKTVEAPKLGNTALMSLLAAAGLSPLAGDSPLAPAPSPILLAVMAWARREFEQTVKQSGVSPAAADNQVSTLVEGQAVPAAAVAAVWQQNPGLATAPVISTGTTAQQVGWTTGPNTNTAHWYIAGTDLGIMWDSGYTDPGTGQPVVYTLFGDTYSAPGMSGDWRNNVLLRSSDVNLSNGLQFSDALIHAGASSTSAGTPEWYPTTGPAAGAAQIIKDPGYNGPFGYTTTIIPTAAIAVHNADGSITEYATIMSVRTWDIPGSWTTNYSAIAYSNDGGETWTVAPSTVRSSGWLRSSKSYVPGNEHFQQNALVYGNP
ncbi:MAG TPA: DUF4185 domain-containing protein, partial [Mycobacterium sp.]|nr:DUF4185 domain-containing protein [Mycobacterium sp.]